MKINTQEKPFVQTEITHMKLRLAADRISTKQPGGIIACLEQIEHP